jgi:hypothetical protein
MTQSNDIATLILQLIRAGVAVKPFTTSWLSLDRGKIRVIVAGDVAELVEAGMLEIVGDKVRITLKGLDEIYELPLP